MAEGCFDVQKKKKNKLGEISMLFRRIIIMLTSERREVFVSGEGNHFYQAIALWKDEVSDEKHEETPCSSDSLFEKNSKFLKQ